MALISSSSRMGYGDRQSSSSFSRKVMTLPRIEHPSKFISEEDRNSLDVRGRSRDGRGDGKLIRSEASTPELTSRHRRSSSVKNYLSPSTHSEQLTQIPENVSVVYGQERDKVRLPIFGNLFDLVRCIFHNIC